MRTIGVVTSGGDAPGMNAAIRAITRIAYSENLQVLGFERGWEGLIESKFRPLTPRSVGGIIQSGGTILHTLRCPQFKRKEMIRKAAETLDLNKVDGLIVIGGNGSFKGALELSRETDTLIVGVPATIDNDVFGTDETIGFDTAVNTAVNEIDKIRDTAISHERTFIVEVMGRKRGFLALTVGITVGAEIILVPEVKFEKEEIFKILKENSAKGKKSSIIVAAEGIGDTRKLAKEIEKNTAAEVRLSILGYAQRGGSPTARSRLLASLFADKAVKLLLKGRGNRIVGLQKGRITSIELEKSCKTEKPLDLKLLRLASVLAT
ncbi:6-phosphofructokinase [Candidatus Bathyarchaeota archaeon]|nr:MAG: 6-phosphofructokinase [Candidatus Bathyarchaeota archaeon]RLI21840.1 MAG: ATP-dependent 6-phosphofructokinase [Candidatus Bathyarchaeota archaeon]